MSLISTLIRVHYLILIVYGDVKALQFIYKMF